jgi:hypothetical protein
LAVWEYRAFERNSAATIPSVNLLKPLGTWILLSVSEA